MGISYYRYLSVHALVYFYVISGDHGRLIFFAYRRVRVSVPLSGGNRRGPSQMLR